MIGRRRRHYALFHLNLAYSSIDEDDHAEVIARCYTPLLEIAQDSAPIGIELSGTTLERIRELDMEWVERFGQLCRDGRCELIGSGYSQIIGPLVPAQINQWNLQFGNEVYDRILGITPQIALINEMAYSTGLCEHYVAAGYKAIVMEWNNPRLYHANWPNRWRYFPQQLDESGLVVIWADSILFQKFQRCAHREVTGTEYSAYLEAIDVPDGGFVPIYSSDAEIFDYRPGRYQTEEELDGGEWRRIAALIDAIGGEETFVLPSNVLEGLCSSDGGHPIELSSAAQPIPVKKQEKYNVYRWALTGRNDFEINTRCHRALRKLLATNTLANQPRRDLCRLWSSDIRTHLTEKRWVAYLDELGRFESRLGTQIADAETKRESAPLPFQRSGFSARSNGRRLEIESAGISMTLDLRKGLSIERLVMRSADERSLLGTLPHGHFDDIRLGADFYSGHFVIEKLGAHKIAGLSTAAPTFEWEGDSLVIGHSSVHAGIEANETLRVSDRHIEIQKSICFPSRIHQIVHPVLFTFDPSTWDRNSLFVETHNGGRLEIFRIGAEEIRHDGFYSPLISARHGFGATEGKITIGDRSRRLCFEHDPAVGAVLPSIVFIPTEDSFLLRLRYSAQEIDETFRGYDAPTTIRCNVRISGART